MRSTILLASSVLTVLTACSGGGSSDPAPQIPSAPTQPVPPPPPPPPAANLSVSQTNLVYGSGATRNGDIDLRLDLYQPDAECTQDRPFAILVHGGGFRGGSKGGTWETNGERLAEEGVVALSIQYRLQPDGPLPSSDYDAFQDAVLAELGQQPTSQEEIDLINAIAAAAEDTLTAIQWVRDNAVALCADPDNYVIWGSSAGANNAHNVVYSIDDYGIDLPVPKPQAVINFWGGEMTPDPMEPGDPPIFILHGDQDQTVLYSEALEKEDDAINNGIPYAFYTVEGAGHGWGSTQVDTTQVDGVTLRELGINFITAHLFAGSPVYEVRSVPVGGSVSSTTQSFDSVPLGAVTASVLETLFPNSPEPQGTPVSQAALVQPLLIQDDQALDVYLPAGAVGPTASGVNWRVPLQGTAEHLYLAYQVFIPEDFDFVRGGVLPGLSGGHRPNQSWNVNPGWSGTGAALKLIRSPGQYWRGVEPRPMIDTGQDAAPFIPGRWHSVEMALVMNTPGSADGSVQTWINGAPVYTATDLALRQSDEDGIEALAFMVFHKGEDVSRAPSDDQSLRFDQLTISTAPIRLE